MNEFYVVIILFILGIIAGMLNMGFIWLVAMIGCFIIVITSMIVNAYRGSKMGGGYRNYPRRRFTSYSREE